MIKPTKKSEKIHKRIHRKSHRYPSKGDNGDWYGSHYQILADLIDKAFYFKEGKLAEAFDTEAFKSLTDDRRRELGLRSLQDIELELPEVSKDVLQEGLVVQGLSCGYKKKSSVIEDLSFSVKKGEVLAITGHNGAGKTTLTRCLCGLLKESDGRILLDGKALKCSARQKESFLVMQDVNHQLFYDSVWNECEQAAGSNTQVIENVLNQFDLLPFKERHPMALSGGQKQRLAVATALLSNKKVLIFDEPTSGLDYRQMKKVSKVIRDLAKQGHIVLVVSHDREFMQEACDSVLTI